MMIKGNLPPSPSYALDQENKHHDKGVQPYKTHKGGIGHLAIFTRMTGFQNMITTMVLKILKFTTFDPKYTFIKLCKRDKK